MRVALLSALLALSAAASAQVPGTPPPEPAPPGTAFPPTAAPPVARPLPTDRPRPRYASRLSGPRFGVTYLNAETVRKINETFGEETYNPNPPYDVTYEEIIDESIPVVTQFGWQFETPLFRSESGLTGVSEWIPLVGGLERGLLLPSLTFLVGVRTPSGLELGLGPNVSATGAAYAITAGFNTQIDDINVPVNVAAVLGRDGPRISALFGFTFSDRRY